MKTPYSFRRPPANENTFMQQRMMRVRTVGSLCSYKIDHCCNNGRDDDPRQLEPVEEWDAEQSWLREIIKRRPEQDNEGNDEQEKKIPAVSARSRTGWTTKHRVNSFCCAIQQRTTIDNEKQKDENLKYDVALSYGIFYEMSNNG